MLTSLIVAAAQGSSAYATIMRPW
jgi:hypothetical protein